MLEPVFLCLTSLQPENTFLISNKTVLKIYQCFGELITSTVVVMKTELASLSFSANVKKIVTKNHVHTQNSRERLWTYMYIRQDIH